MLPPQTAFSSGFSFLKLNRNIRHKGWYRRPPPLAAAGLKCLSLGQRSAGAQKISTN